MKTHFLLLCAGLLLAACSKKDTETATPTQGDGTVTWTHNGTTYTSTAYSSAIVDSDTSLLITGSSADRNNIVSLRLRRIYKRGATTYSLLKGSVLNDGYPLAGLTLNGNTGNLADGRQFNSLYGPAATNGTVVVSKYDAAKQQVSGTFSFTAGAVPNSPATGTQTVSNGSFSFTKFL